MLLDPGLPLGIPPPKLGKLIEDLLMSVLCRTPDYFAYPTVAIIKVGGKETFAGGLQILLRWHVKNWRYRTETRKLDTYLRWKMFYFEGILCRSSS